MSIAEYQTHFITTFFAVFHLLEWILHQIKLCLVTHKSFVLLLPLHTLQTGHHCRTKVLWLGWCYVYVLVLCRLPS